MDTLIAETMRRRVSFEFGVSGWDFNYYGLQRVSEGEIRVEEVCLEVIMRRIEKAEDQIGIN